MPKPIRTLSATFGLALATVVASGCASRPSVPTTPPRIPADQAFDAVRADISRRAASGELKSVAIGVIKGGEVVWAEAFGLADAETGSPATIDTPYGIASMGKAITAATAMTLVERKKLRLEADVRSILGRGAVSIREGDRAPTVRELLNMTSGVPHGALTYFEVPPAKEADILARQSFVAFPAGTTFHYSNFAIAMMERVIAEACNRSFEDCVDRAIFRPLGMRGARIGANLEGVAIRYRDDGARYEPLTPLPRSSRQMNASLADLLQFAAMNLKLPLENGESPLSAQSIDSMHNDKSTALGAHIALGIGHFDLGDGARLIASTGNDMGVQSSMFLLPEAGAGAVVLANSSGFQSDEMAALALDAAAPGFLQRFLAAVAAFEARTTPFRPSANWLGKWCGNVEDGADGVPVCLTIAETSILISLRGDAEVKVAEAAMRDGLLTGAFEGLLPLYEAPDGPHRVELSLIAGADELRGFAVANFRSSRGKFEIPARMSLSRVDRR